MSAPTADSPELRQVGQGFEALLGDAWTAVPTPGPVDQVLLTPLGSGFLLVAIEDQSGNGLGCEVHTLHSLALTDGALRLAEGRLELGKACWSKPPLGAGAKVEKSPPPPPDLFLHPEVGANGTFTLVPGASARVHPTNNYTGAPLSGLPCATQRGPWSRELALVDVGGATEP